MTDVRLEVAIFATFDPVNAEWTAKVNPQIVGLGGIEHDAEPEDLEPTHYIAGSLPEINSSLETVVWRLQRVVEAVHAGLSQLPSRTTDIGPGPGKEHLGDA